MTSHNFDKSSVAADIGSMRANPLGGRRANVTAVILLLARMAGQAIVMFSIARLLGAGGYGAFAGVVALAALLAPLSGLGADSLALRAVAQSPELTRPVLRAGARAIALSGIPLLAIAFVASVWWFGEHVSWPLVVSVLFADILMLRIPELVAKIFQGRHLVTEMGITRLLPSAFRLLAIAVLWTSSWPVTPTSWAVFYAIGSLAAATAAISWLLVLSRDECNSLAAPNLLAKDGLHFAGGVLSARLHCEADKSLVMALSGPAQAGIYSAAYRVVEFSLVPVYAVQSVVYGRLFREAHRGGAATAALIGLRATTFCLTLGIAASCILWIALVPTMQWFLGPSFAAVRDGLPAVALLPVAMSLRLSGEQSVAAVGRLGERSLVQWLLAASALCANLWFIPRHGWTAAAWISLTIEALLGLVYTLLAVRTIRTRASEGAEA